MVNSVGGHFRSRRLAPRARCTEHARAPWNGRAGACGGVWRGGRRRMSLLRCGDGGPDTPATKPRFGRPLTCAFLLVRRDVTGARGWFAPGFLRQPHWTRPCNPSYRTDHPVPFRHRGGVEAGLDAARTTICGLGKIQWQAVWRAAAAAVRCLDAGAWATDQKPTRANSRAVSEAEEVGSLGARRAWAV